MKREIKFRAFASTDDGLEMVYFGSCECDNGLWFNSPKHIDGYESAIMQYTGLKDKNGKEIYEGDIYCMIGSYFKVIFENGAFCVTSVKNYNPTTLGWKPENEDDCCVDDFVNKIEIIGNIYENAELLTS